MKILVVKPSALGDVIQALPVATGLRRHWPEAEIHWVINDAYADLLKGHPAIQKLILYPRCRWKSVMALPEVWRWARALRAEQYDLVLDLQGLLRSGLMTWATGAKRKLGSPLSREGAGCFYNEWVSHASTPSAAERYLDFLRHLGVTPDPYDFGLCASESWPVSLQRKSYWVLHPYSRWRTKLWPWQNYQYLVEALPEYHFVVVGDGPWFPLSGQNVEDWRKRTSLPQLMSLLSQAQGVVSTDSGPGHLAAALGVPTLVLFGATDPQKTGAVGKRVTILQEKLECIPCLRRRCDREEKMGCLRGLKVDRVKKWILDTKL